MREIKFDVIWESGTRYGIITPLDTDFIMQAYPEKTHKRQYTWLKDSKWKEIFEGDIVKWNDDSDDIWYIESWTWIVKFHPDYLRFDIWFLSEVDKDFKWTYMLLSRVKNCEIIGNRFENPELLKS